MKHPATLLCIVSLACSGSALALWWCEAPSIAWMAWALALVVLAVALWAWREGDARDDAPPPSTATEERAEWHDDAPRRVVDGGA